MCNWPFLIKRRLYKVSKEKQNKTNNYEDRQWACGLEPGIYTQGNQRPLLSSTDFRLALYNHISLRLQAREACVVRTPNWEQLHNWSQIVSSSLDLAYLVGHFKVWKSFLSCFKPTMAFKNSIPSKKKFTIWYFSFYAFTESIPPTADVTALNKSCSSSEKPTRKWPFYIIPENFKCKAWVGKCSNQLPKTLEFQYKTGKPSETSTLRENKKFHLLIKKLEVKQKDIIKIEELNMVVHTFNSSIPEAEAGRIYVSWMSS